MGVCMRRELDPETNEEGELKGIRIPIFNYSGREVLAINKWNEKVKAEIQNVKCKSQTEAKIGGWIYDGLPQNAVYEKDDVTHLKKCKKNRQELLLSVGIRTVEDIMFKNKSAEEIQAKLAIISNNTNLSLQLLNTFHKQSCQSLPGRVPPEVSYLNAENPFEARYGSSWEQKVGKVRRMGKYCCIKELVRHIDDTSR